jgi:site-specific DNA recombinase
MKSAAIYCRISTDYQKEGASLDEQEHKARLWCELNDYEVKGVFVDSGISGKNADNRPAFQEALACVSKGDALVVYKFDRFARNTVEAITISDSLGRRGVDLVSISQRIDTTTAAGKMMFRMLAVLSEFESDQTSERVKSTMQHIRKQNGLVGSIPYGFKRDDNVTKSSDKDALVLDDTEQKIIKLARQLHTDKLSLRKIGAELSRQGFIPRGGKSWHPDTVKRIVENDLTRSTNPNCPL